MPTSTSHQYWLRHCIKSSKPDFQETLKFPGRDPEICELPFYWGGMATCPLLSDFFCSLIQIGSSRFPKSPLKVLPQKSQYNQSPLLSPHRGFQTIWTVVSLRHTAHSCCLVNLEGKRTASVATTSWVVSTIQLVPGSHYSLLPHGCCWPSLSICLSVSVSLAPLRPLCFMPARQVFPHWVYSLVLLEL